MTCNLVCDRKLVHFDYTPLSGTKYQTNRSSLLQAHFEVTFSYWDANMTSQSFWNIAEYQFLFYSWNCYPGLLQMETTHLPVFFCKLVVNQDGQFWDPERRKNIRKERRWAVLGKTWAAACVLEWGPAKKIKPFEASLLTWVKYIIHKFKTCIHFQVHFYL